MITHFESGLEIGAFIAGICAPYLLVKGLLSWANILLIKKSKKL